MVKNYLDRNSVKALRKKSNVKNQTVNNIMRNLKTGEINKNKNEFLFILIRKYFFRLFFRFFADWYSSMTIATEIRLINKIN